VASLVESLVEGGSVYGAVFTNARATSLEPCGNAVRVTTEAERFEADAVVLAAGAWASALCGPTVAASMQPVRPIRGQLLHLRVPHSVASRVLWGPSCYVVPRLDGTVLVGATVEDVGFDERPTLGGVRALATAAATLVPALESAALEGVRVGLRPATKDELPIVGRSAATAGVFHALGHYRNGVLLAPLTAQLLADLVVDGREGAELEVLRPSRFGL
jgi:glycine oxidase